MSTLIQQRIRAGACFAMALSLAFSGALKAAETEDHANDEDVQDLRERLTEREDENKVEEPWVVDILGRPLSVYGQYEFSLDYLDRLAVGAPGPKLEQLLLEQEIEVEAFYAFAPSLSLFIQLRLLQEEDLDADTPDDVSDIFVERGEAWLYAEEIGGSRLSLEVGRLDFEDDRLWWWDEDLDALRIAYETDSFEITLAAARELAPARSDRSYVEPEHNQVFRLIAEASWDWSEQHAVQFFLLSHDDRSRTERPGDIVRLNREDESDADLTWLGFRASGAVDTDERGAFGYWIDAGMVGGDEVLVGTDEDQADAGGAEGEEEEEEQDDDEETAILPPGRCVVGDVADLDVRGWAFDTGVTWLLPVAAEPRITIGYAMGSGDGKPENRTDRAFRQTGLHGNEPGFGGVQRFQGYGELLDPELSNISILTLGIGCSLLNSSSVDLIFHDYRLIESADSLRDARIDAELTGRNRDLGQGIDLVLGFEEWERVEFEFKASAFRAGKAFGTDHDEWMYGWFFAGRLAF